MTYNKIISDYLTTIDDDKLVLVNEYIETLNTMEKKALGIAIDHLETSFNIVKSIGYVKWLKSTKTK
jgi:hypothetical protein